MELLIQQLYNFLAHNLISFWSVVKNDAKTNITFKGLLDILICVKVFPI